jgi:hypothetical protein
VPPDPWVTASLIELSRGLLALHESAGCPMRRKPFTSAAAPHCQLPGTRANPSCPSKAAPRTQTNATFPPTIVADPAGSKRRTPGFDPAIVTARCFALESPRETAAQNAVGVGVALGRGVVDGAAEAAGEADPDAAGLDADWLAPAALDCVPPVGTTLGDVPHPAAAKARSNKSPAGLRWPARAAARNIGRS